MSVDPARWEEARRTVRRAVGSSIHCSVASVNPDGSAHVTPIGSIILTGVGEAFYFDMFNRRLAENVASDPRVTIMAVDSSRPFWLRSLLRGRFERPPGLRLRGEVGPPRAATSRDVAAFHRIVGPLRRTRGGRLLWGDLSTVRDVHVTEAVPLRFGPMPVGPAAGVTPGGAGPPGGGR